MRQIFQQSNVARPNSHFLAVGGSSSSRGEFALHQDALRFGAFRFDRGRGELSRGGDNVHLTAAEAGLLAILAQRAGEPVSREELSQAASFSGNIRNVDVQMTRLRRKIERDPRYPRYLQTVRGTGYVLKPE